MIEILAEIAESPRIKAYSRFNSVDQLLEKALAFDEDHFKKVELVKVRELLKDNEAGRSKLLS